MIGSRVAKGMQKRFVLLVGSALAMVAACDDTPYTDASACQHGDTRECVGPGACKGAQECLPTRLGFGSCECADPSTPNGGSGAGMTSQAGAGSDAVGGMQMNPGGTPGAAGVAGASEPIDGGAGGEGGAGGAAVEYACDPIGNVGCGSSQNCSLDGAERACVPGGTKTLLAKCDQTSECAPGLLCSFHNCVKACSTQADCTDASTRCGLSRAYPELGLGLVGGCVKSCDPTSQNCPIGQACYWGSCLTPNSAQTEGAPCELATDCAMGLECIGYDSTPTCHRYCSTSALDQCASGSTCLSLEGVLPNLPAHWGACIQQ